MGDDGCAAIRVGMGYGEVGLRLTPISPIPRCRTTGDRLFELFDLVTEECCAESAGHGELVGCGSCGGPLGRDKWSL